MTNPSKPTYNVPRKVQIKAAVMLCGDAGTTSPELCASTGIHRSLLSVLLNHYCKRGFLHKVGPRLHQRYYATAEQAQAAAPLVAAQETARAEQAQQRREATRQAWKSPSERATAPNRDAVLSAINHAGPDGITRGDLSIATGLQVVLLGATLQRLIKQGQVVQAGRTQYLHFFPSQEAATAWEAREERRLKALYAQRSEADALREDARAAMRRKKARRLPPADLRCVPTLPAEPAPVQVRKAKPEPRPVVIPDNVKRTVATTRPGRYEVSGPVIGGFATLPFGQYLDGQGYSRYLEGARA